MLTQQAFQPAELSKTIKKLHNCYLNNGYPFAELQMTVKETNPETSFLQLKVERKNFYVWNEIQVKGDSSISETYIANLLNIKLGEPYDESILRSIPKLFAQVPFMKQDKVSEILFTSEGAELYVYVSGKNTNSINGFLGLQPNQDNTRYKVTGEINLKFQNILKRGEYIALDWRNLQGETQQLKKQPKLSLPV